MKKTVYIDTSVVGGKFDIEFEFWTNLFFKSVEAGEFKIVISNILKIKKDFDAVNMMRKIRDKIDRETAGMTFEQLKKYYEKKAKKNQN